MREKHTRIQEKKKKLITHMYTNTRTHRSHQSHTQTSANAHTGIYTFAHLCTEAQLNLTHTEPPAQQRERHKVSRDCRLERER